jgi:hypothetical protein
MALFGILFFLFYKPAVADLLWEKNIISRLINRADKLSRTGKYMHTVAFHISFGLQVLLNCP